MIMKSKHNSMLSLSRYYYFFKYQSCYEWIIKLSCITQSYNKFYFIFENCSKKTFLKIELFKKQLDGKIEVEEITQNFKFINGVKSIPHYKKKGKGGDDYFYVIDRLLVVADGVGGWKNYDINPAEFSKELCQNIYENFHDYEIFLKMKYKNSKKNINLSLSDFYPDTKCEDEYKEGFYSEKIVKKLLVKSTNMTTKEGTSTCTILMLDKSTGKVYTTQVGDSCYMILKCDIESGKYYKEFKSKEKMHKESFNTPYQVGKHGDNPELADTKTHQLENNDIIISATDGLWDNLKIVRILEIVNELKKSYTNIIPQDLADKLAEEALALSKDKKYFSPFAKKARENNLTYMGGKPDDITVIVSLITTNKNSLYYETSTNTSTTDPNEKMDDFY